MSDLQNQVIKPFLEDIWESEEKCINPYHDEDCDCLFNYYINYLEKALTGRDEYFDWILYIDGELDKKGLVKVVIKDVLEEGVKDILDEDIEEKAEQLLIMYKSYKN